MGATGDRIKGKAMKVEGRLTGDRVRRGQGAMKDAKGEARGMLDRAKRKVKGIVRNAKAKVSRTRTKARVKTRARAY